MRIFTKKVKLGFFFLVFFAANSFTVLAQDKLLVLLPGETFTPGIGKSGTPNPTTPNAAVTVRVYAVDAGNNVLTSVNDNVTLTSSDVNGQMPLMAPLSSGANTSFSVRLRTAGTATITATNAGNTLSGVSSSITVNSGAYTRLIMLMPGETPAPGSSPGKTGTITPQLAGIPFDITVLAVDSYFNVVATVNDEIAITNQNASNDTYTQLPPNANLSAGVGTFNVILRKAPANYRLIATNVVDSKTILGPSITVNRGTYSKLLVILPGEQHDPGSITGKTVALPSDRVAGSTSPSITVYATDACWNRITAGAPTNSISMSTDDPASTNPSNKNMGATGSVTFSPALRTAGMLYAVTVADQTQNGDIESYTSPLINVIPGGYSKLILILPGENSAPGIAAGKQGAPDDQVAGQPFPVLVRAIDAFGNTVTTVNNTVTFVATNDGFAQLPPNTSLINGELTASATYRIGNATKNRTLRVRDVVDNTKTQISAAFGVSVGDYAGLLVILPGEGYQAGALNGKTNAPIGNQGLNQPFPITVRAVDAAFNTIVGMNDLVAISSNDPSATFSPQSAQLVNGVKTNFSVTLNSASSSTTITATITKPDLVTTYTYTTGFITVLGASSPSGFFRSAVTLGNWSNSSSWESSATGGESATDWQSATITPTNAASGILVRNGHTIDIIANLIVDDVIIQNGAMVNHTAGTLTINNGPAAYDFLVEGTFRSASVVTNNGVLRVANLAKYQHNSNLATRIIPVVDWATGSTCEIIGYTNYAGDVPGSNQTFSNFVWNASGQTAAGSPSLLDGFQARDFTVISTGLGTLNLGSVGGTAIITRDYLQSDGKVVVNKTSGIQNLRFGGDVNVSGGTFSMGSGTANVIFDGGTQNIEAVGNIEFGNVTFSNSGTKTLNSGSFSLATDGVLTMNPSAILNANGKLTIKSNASGSGTIAAIPNSSSIIGDVAVERFIQGGGKNPFRTYRMFSSPIYDNGNPIDRTYSFTQFIDNMLITGRSAGFDQLGNSGTSAWTYDNGYVAIPSIDTNVPAGKGAYLLYRGNRSNETDKVATPYVDPEDVVMDFKGILNQQDVTVPLTYAVETSGFNLLGNPYASSINWDAVSAAQKADLEDNVISIFNPALRQYATYDGVTSANGGSNIIPAGQGFFVKAKSGGGSFTFTESNKALDMPADLLMAVPVGDNQTAMSSSGKLSVANARNVFSASPQSELRTWLKKEETPFKVETVVVFKDGTSADYVSKEDVSYARGSDVYMSSLTNDNKRAVINYMPAIVETTNVALDLDSLNASGNYALELNYTNIPSGYLVKLTDNYLGTSAFVENGTDYSFTIDRKQLASSGPSRFIVSFEAPVTLPVTYNTLFTAAKTNQGVALKWSTATETNHNRFEVERAADNGVYEKIHTELAKGSGSSYSFIDSNPLLGNNYYRLVQYDNNNTSKVTSPQVINYTGGIESATDLVSVFPNPVISNFTVKFNGVLKANQQTIKIVSAAGKILLTQNVSKTQLISGHDIAIADFAAGVYILEVYENGTQRIGQMKLIKQ
ncbi:T9SS type A sorting domain-containing protein [Pedobacter xixiisoli]|uniref:Secretion system C-terminal sorting domain-containing protein n=1 Tax=Pedobacter xixiisoli TaxID=1476464 RepID=A0A286A7Y5_9SPHI|nr:T9SS type A sorting domain-containing protein [Pedobacter xixiisoli]SOD17951.1 hypothetical protein SAMN06297358_2752 [Pedobacter xixiisoli]